MTADVGTFRALDHRFAIEVDGDVGVDLGALFDGIGSPGESPDVRYTFVAGDDDTADLLEDGELIGNGRIRVLLQILIGRLGQRALDPDTVAFHGATVGDERGAVMLVGPSGHGKSTLAARLLIDGLDLVAEDISALEPGSGAIRPYHRPLGLSEASFGLLGREIPAAAGAPCGCGGKVLVSGGHLGFSYSGALPIRAVALVARNDDHLEQLVPARMLARLLELGVVVTTDDPSGLDAVAALLAGARCVEIGSADLAQAADWIGQLLDRRQTDTENWLVESRGASSDVFIGTEAVVVADGNVQHLNQAAAAIHLLHTDGLGVGEIAAELALDHDDVEDVLAEIG